MASETRLTPKEKQNRYRRRLRRKGLRPVQIWVPDTRAAGFAAECRRQARLAARSAQEQPVLDFITKIAAWDNG
ncbi:MAG TPA: antitoxin MazE family protein [Nitrospira sp.]|nr:antitoxin MazE family protein [Nitrospira sp.]